MFWVPNATAAATSASSAGYIPAKTPSESGSDKVSKKKHFRIREINQTRSIFQFHAQKLSARGRCLGNAFTTAVLQKSVPKLFELCV